MFQLNCSSIDEQNQIEHQADHANANAAQMDWDPSPEAAPSRPLCADLPMEGRFRTRHSLASPVNAATASDFRRRRPLSKGIGRSEVETEALPFSYSRIGHVPLPSIHSSEYHRPNPRMLF